MQINTNIAAMNAYRNLHQTESQMDQSLERLSSGLRINRAADDAAGLSISEKMRGQISGLDQASSNAQDGISLIQTAEGALDESHSILQRMRELAVQSANDTLTASDRVEIQREIDQLADELDRIGDTTEFNTKNLLDGSASALTSTSDADTDVYMRGSVEEGGNWDIDINEADVGDNQVQKTDIMRAAHDIDDLDIEQGDVIESGDIGEVALRDLENFYDSSGNFILDDPKDLELIQGDGYRANVTLYGDDTIDDVVDKLNEAIHEDLNQERLFDNAEVQDYVQYVGPDEAEADGHFATGGTMVMQSAVAGSSGQINPIADEDVLNAFGLEEIQEATETEFEVHVSDAHDDEADVEEVTITGNMLRGVVDDNVDVEFYHSAGIEAADIEEFEAVDLTFDGDADDAEQQVHIADNSMIFHIGANPMQNVDASIGNMRADALGVDGLVVTDQDSANRAIEQIDQAIEQVSSERARAGAMQNRLEHTIANLGVAEENLTAAESRIRDLDMAEEMVDFTRHQIMMQAGSSMLAQANMKPENVLALLG